MITLLLASFAVVMAAGFGVVGVFAFTRLRAVRGANQADGEYIFSPSRYDAMLRLLSDQDLEYLKEQPGFTAKMATEWKRGQRRILKTYLRDLACDFSTMHAQARQLLAETEVQDADLVSLLVRQQTTFWMAMVRVEFRLAANRLGVSVDVRALIDSISTVGLELERRMDVAASIA